MSMYKKRPPMGDRFIRSPTQAQPRSAWPRDLADAVKNPPATALHQIQQIVQPDGTQLWGIGKAAAQVLNGGSVTETSPGWFDEIDRFCFLVEVVSVGSITWRYNGVQITMSPVAWLDPASPYVPAIWRFEDIIAARLMSPGVGDDGFIHFGMTSVSGSGLQASPSCFIGFAANWSDTAFGTWNAVCVDGTGGSTVDGGNGLNQALDFTTEDPHRLGFEIDGSTKTVRYYVDGTLVLEYEPDGTDLPSTTTFEMQLRWQCGVDDTGSIKAGFWIDSQPNATVEVVDEAA